MCAVLLTSGLPMTIAADAAPARQVTADDLPRIPPTEPDKALATFKLARHCELELVAAEPLVADPIDACFDEFGRMYVAEMHGYPFSQEPTRLNPAGGGKPDAGIIRLLEDTDGDGTMDRSTVFADAISWPTSVCCYNGGVFVLAPQFLYYFKDTDGDRRADVREIVLSGFGRDNVQSLANGLKWGIDQHISFAAGRNPGPLEHRGTKLMSLSGSDLRFDPKSENFTPVTGGQQFGHAFDDFGNRFVCSNSNHIQHVVFPGTYLGRNPGLAVSGLIRNVASDGASARVFRISPPEPWRIIRQKWRAAEKGYELVINSDGAWEFLPLDPAQKKGVVPTEYPDGYFTSATGITMYRGGAFPAEFQGNAFVGDVGGNLVHRKSVKPAGVTFIADRADAGEEFIRSTDNWFRPVNFVNAPDGTLYVLDMYRETVEHPYSIPDEIKQFLHLESGDDRGRIYRIVTPDMERVSAPRIGEMAGGQLVAQFESRNAWNRETAQRLLWERQDRSAIPSLTDMVRTSTNELARLHAFHALAGFGPIEINLLLTGLADSSAVVREHVVRLAESELESSVELVAAVVKLARDDADRVRFQVAFSLGETDRDQALDGLVQLARDPRGPAEVRTALLSSVADRADRLAIQLLQDAEFLRQAHSSALLRDLCLIIGANPDVAHATRLIDFMTSTAQPIGQQQLLLSSLGAGLRRRGGSVQNFLGGMSASTVVRTQIAKLFDRAVNVAQDEQQPMAQRAAAIGLLGFADFALAREALPEFLSPQIPQALQQAAIEALGQQQSDDAARLILDAWPTMSPVVRRDAIEALFANVGRLHKLLDAVAAKTVGRSDIERDRKQLLLNHPDGKVRFRSRELFGSEVNSDRVKVVADLQHVLELEGLAERGQVVFTKKCSVCHRVGTVGHQVAPDLASVQNKSAADLLISILDPNREAQPAFNTYNVMTEDGRVFSGIIAAETSGSITLRKAEAREDVILRNNIDSLVSTGISLMPEGLEKDLSPQDLADVIAFVRSIKTGR